MRCSNCGWTNPEGVTRCQKCNQPLAASQPVAVPAAPQPVVSNSGNVCPNCGYPASVGEVRCPQCGYELSSVQSSPLPDNPNNRVTTMAEPVNNADGRATVMSAPMSADGNRATVMSAPMSADGNRATVMSTPSYAPKPMMDMPRSSQPSSASYSVTLSCMDDASHSEITIQSAQSLALRPGEIILIAGLRYIVK